MATKAKTETAPKSTPVPAQAAPSPHAIAYAKAVKLVDTGKYPEAVKALEALMSEAQETGDWAVKRRAQVYLLLAQAKVNPPAKVTEDPLTEIQACLNRHATDEAVKLVDKAIKSHPAVGSLHYLRSVAFAQTENVEESAQSLKKAMELDANFVFQWHMEPDFNAIRKSPLFAFTENR